NFLRRAHGFVGSPRDPERLAKLVDDILIGGRDAPADRLLADTSRALPIGIDVAAGEFRARGCKFLAVTLLLPLRIGADDGGLTWRRSLQVFTRCARFRTSALGATRSSGS